MAAITRFQIGKKVFRLMFEDLLRPLSPIEMERLSESIRRDCRVRVPLVCIAISDTELGVIDGCHRVRAAAAENLQSIPFSLVADYDQSKLRDLALELNLARRHLTAEEQAEARGERLEKVKELRQEQKSVRQIAEATGMSPSQIQRDIRDVATVPGGTVHGATTMPPPLPKTIIGKDQKPRKASVARPKRSNPKVKKALNSLERAIDLLKVREHEFPIGRLKTRTVGDVARVLGDYLKAQSKS